MSVAARLAALQLMPFGGDFVVVVTPFESKVWDWASFVYCTESIYDLTHSSKLSHTTESAYDVTHLSKTPRRE